MTVILVIVAIGSIVFWMRQVFLLMEMPDDVFPGRFDKATWAAILLVTSVFGGLVFMIWRWTAQADREVERLAREIGGIAQHASTKSEGQ